MSGSGEHNLVSIIIPVHNRAELVIGALDSAVGQTYCLLEIIVVNDGSTDNLIQNVKRWFSAIDRPLNRLLILNKRKGGAPSARNLGLLYARGEFIQFLDSDDKLAPAKIEHQVDALRKDMRAGFAYGKLQKVNVERGPVTISQVETAANRYKRASLENTPSGIAVGLFAREACRRIGPWAESLQRHQDWQYCLRYLALGIPVLCSPEIVYYHVEHSGVRINDIQRDHTQAVQCMFEAVYSVERELNGDLSAPVAKRVAQKYSRILVESIIASDCENAAAAIKGLRGHTWKLSSIRIKNESLFYCRKLLGCKISSSIARLAIR